MEVIDIAGATLCQLCAPVCVQRHSWVRAGMSVVVTELPSNVNLVLGFFTASFDLILRLPDLLIKHPPVCSRLQPVIFDASWTVILSASFTSSTSCDCQVEWCSTCAPVLFS